MPNFQIGDRVRVISPTMNHVTGQITSKSVRPTRMGSRAAMDRAYDTETDWHLWQIKLDTTGKLQTFPADELEKIE